MNSLMSKVCGLPEDFSAFLIGSLSSVDSFMLIKMSDLDEGFPTFFAFIWFLSRMNSLMDTKGLTMAKGFATCATFIRFLSRMTSAMTDK